jgi:hypothetical protein
VESVTKLADGKVRIVLKEPVKAITVQRNGHIYVEEEEGTILAPMVVAAFDLNFTGSSGLRFPSAIAWGDKECRHTAKHTNIMQSSGKVCLGDINDGTMRMAEVELAGYAVPSIGDFVQMLRMCNLDSAYNTHKSFIFQNPDICTDEHFAGARWDIPGLRRLRATKNELDELRRQTPVET